MSDFSFPTNIKQIGSIGEDFRIYIEDYAASYLHQYAESGGYEERIAFLIGRNMIIDSTNVLFISGVILGLHSHNEDEILTFSDKSWQHVNSEISKYFKGLDVVGWMHSQPGYGTNLNINYNKLHKKMFIKPYQVLFLIDPIEKMNSFYIFDEKEDKLNESLGYFIYYDKNRGMHEYMLDNKLTKLKVRVMPEIVSSCEAFVEVEKEERKHFKLPDKKAIKRDLPRKNVAGQKRMFKMLSTLSASLFLISIISVMGISRNNGRITELETQLTALNTAYRDLLVSSDSNTKAVFATKEKPLESIDVSLEPNSKEEAPVLIVENGKNLLASTENKAEITQQKPNTQENIQTAPVETKKPEAPIQAPTPAPKPKAKVEAEIKKPKVYVVQKGDNLHKISVEFYGDSSKVKEIMELNSLTEEDKIFFGKKILLP